MKNVESMEISAEPNVNIENQTFITDTSKITETAMTEETTTTMSTTVTDMVTKKLLTNYLTDSSAVPCNSMAAGTSNLLISVFRKLPKLPKIPKVNKLTSESLAIEQQTNPYKLFRSSKPKEMDKYNVPEEIAQIELDNNADEFMILGDMANSNESKQNVESYLKIASSCLYLEECASSAHVRCLSGKNINIKLLGREKNVFAMKVVVSIS